MKRIAIIAWVTSAMISWSASAFAGPCDAHFLFDGTLADVSGNGYNGEMFNAEGSSRPKYTAGKFGQALQLDGTAAMRALLDLHYDSCPQVTMSAWIQVSRDVSNDTMHVLSSGQGSGPGLRVSDTYLTLAGTNNGVGQPNAIRKGTNWTFVAGVYDYTAGHFTMYWGNRNSGTQNLAEYRYPPETAFWVGTVNDQWGIYTSGIAIDDLRISGTVAGAEQIAALRSGSAVSTQVAGTSATSAPQPQPQPKQLPSSVDHND